jgi:hypothetical protein
MKYLYATIFHLLLFAAGFLYLRLGIWCWFILSPSLWGWWLGISYSSVALVVFILAKKLNLGGIAFDCIQGILISLMWLPFALLSPLVLLIALGELFLAFTDTRWNNSRIGQSVNRWWSSTK